MQDQSKGLVLHIMDFAEHMEDCMASVFRACMCAKKLSLSTDSFESFCQSHHGAIESLRKLRNLHEHMHTQIASGEVGNGPILLSLVDDGDAIRFRDARMSLASLNGLIEGLYSALLPLFPQFDGGSPPEPRGVPSLSITATIRVEDGKHSQS